MDLGGSGLARVRRARGRRVCGCSRDRYAGATAIREVASPVTKSFSRSSERAAVPLFSDIDRESMRIESSRV